ncbi:hypothetical protein CGC21_36570 [Leishmania donovani]|uniref:Uncharacterized protein n=1 Tax=Leishmania donovani TaxID=5661 RepID=A0A504XBQ8_LEIDO|nr:hypothetical protein CGC21_36570 [Leishmania donovani]
MARGTVNRTAQWPLGAVVTVPQPYVKASLSLSPSLTMAPARSNRPFVPYSKWCESASVPHIRKEATLPTAIPVHAERAPSVRLVVSWSKRDHGRTSPRHRASQALSADAKRPQPCPAAGLQALGLPTQSLGSTP